MDCRHWKELDNGTTIFEFCKARRVRVSCTGVFKQCDDKRYFNVSDEDIEKLKAQDSINRTIVQEVR